MPTKRAFIVPGTKQQAADYKNLATALRREGYDTVPVEVNWKEPCIRRVMEETAKQVNESHSKDLLLGFSVGGSIALNIPFSGLKILCSPPDIYEVNGSRKALDRIYRLMCDVELNWEGVVLPKQLPGKVQILVGTRDAPAYWSWARSLSTKIGAPLQYSANGHDIENLEYVETVVRVLRNEIE